MTRCCTTMTPRCCFWRTKRRVAGRADAALRFSTGLGAALLDGRTPRCCWAMKRRGADGRTTTLHCSSPRHRQAGRRATTRTRLLFIFSLETQLLFILCLGVQLLFSILSTDLSV
jgi:hypothetical protein